MIQQAPNSAFEMLDMFMIQVLDGKAPISQ